MSFDTYAAELAQQPNRLFCGITVCQEKAIEIFGTLISLAQNMCAFADRDLPVVVAIICDGVPGKMHETTKEMLLNFGCEIPEENQVTHTHLTLFPDAALFRKDVEDENLDWENAWESLRKVELIAIVKHKNQGKAHSHDLLFTLAKKIHTKYLFMTDAGTTFKYNCLQVLLDALDLDTQLVGVTGRQRAATARQMRVSKFEWLLSPAALQLFEFEWTSSTNMAPFTLLGFLPVMPGPCQMFHWQRMFQRSTVIDPIQRYLEMCRYKGDLNDDLMEVKILSILAEDRLLVALVAAATGLKTKWIPGATFVYRPELEFRRLLEQRRRWINGATFVYVWLLTPDGTRALLNHGRIKNKRLLQLLWEMQVFQYLTCLLSPALFSICLRDGVSYIWEHVVDHFEPLSQTSVVSGMAQWFRVLFISGIPDLAGFGFLFAVMLWTLIAHIPKEVGNWKRFFNVLAWVYLVMSAGVMILILSGFILSMYQSNEAFGSQSNQILVLMVWVTQFVLACAFSWTSAIRSLVILPLFLLGQCFYVCLIPAYALGRLWSTSWGTNTEKVATERSRLLPESNQQQNVGSSNSAKRYRRMVSFGRKRLILFFVVNVLLAIALRAMMLDVSTKVTVWLVTILVFGPTLPNTLLTLFLIGRNIWKAIAAADLRRSRRRASSIRPV